MNRRKFLQLFSTAIVGLAVPKIVLAEKQINSTLAPYKGRTLLEAGFFYCPYIPLQTPSANNVEYVSFNTRYNAPVAQLE